MALHLVPRPHRLLARGNRPAAVSLGARKGTAARRCHAQGSAGMFDMDRPYAPPEWAGMLHPVPKERVRLGHFPTPIHEWKLPRIPDDVQVFVKRDDLSGMQLSGNKVRKLEFLLADAKAKGCDSVITIGGIQSNHCRATAVASKYLGLDCFLILRNSRAAVDSDPGLTGNLLVERLVGAQIEQVTKEEYTSIGSEELLRIKEGRLREAGRNPYVIPVGGSNSLGTWGYLHFIEELKGQIDNQSFTDIAMACGSGGTTAGIGLGCHLSGLKLGVHAYGVCDTPRYFYDFCQGILDGMGAVQASVGRSSQELFEAAQAKGSGYAISTQEELEFVKEVAEATGVILDPVYSGKAAFRLCQDILSEPEKWKGRKVLFLHTGGLLGMYEKEEQLMKLVDPTKASRMKV